MKNKHASNLMKIGKKLLLFLKKLPLPKIRKKIHENFTGTIFGKSYIIFIIFYHYFTISQ